MGDIPGLALRRCLAVVFWLGSSCLLARGESHTPWAVLGQSDGDGRPSRIGSSLHRLFLSFELASVLLADSFDESRGCNVLARAMSSVSTSSR